MYTVLYCVGTMLYNVIIYISLLQGCGFGIGYWDKLVVKTELCPSVNIFGPNMLILHMVDLESHTYTCYLYSL